MGEIIKCVKTALAQASDEFVAVQTLGGRMHVRWDHEAQATPHGQIVYFAEFLATAGIFDNQHDREGAAGTQRREFVCFAFALRRRQIC